MAHNLNLNFDTSNGKVLARFYDRLMQGLLQRIEGFDPDLESLDKLKADVDGVLDQAENVSVEFANIEMPDQYAKGINDANKILSAIGVKLTSTNQASHEAIVRQMIKEMGVNFGKSITAVRASMDGAISKVILKQMQDTFAEGLVAKEATNAAIQILRENMVQSIVDRGGKTWTLQTYVDMVRRTTARVAFNQGMINRSLEIGIKVFKVSYTGTRHNACAVWENRLVSLNGEFNLPTIEQATRDGLFHPNCYHTVFPDVEAQKLLETGQPLPKDQPILELDFTKFADTRKSNTPTVMSLVQSERDLLRLFPNFGKAQQEVVMRVAQDSGSPVAGYLKKIYEGNTVI